MFRTRVLRFAATSYRMAEGISGIEAAQQYAIGISKAQAVAQRGFLDGAHVRCLTAAIDD